MYIGLRIKCPLFLSYFNKTYIFPTVLKKYIRISNFTKIRPVGAEFFHADGRMDRHDEAIVAFPNFAKAPTNENNNFNKL